MVASKPHLFPPFRADQIGSLKRPAKLLAKRNEFDEGKCSAEALKVVEDEAITAIVEMQRVAGIKAITDGEFRRYAVHSSRPIYMSNAEYLHLDTCSTRVYSTTSMG